MANPTPHGAGVRGFNLAPSSRFFNGRFGRLFRALPPADFGDDDSQSMAALHQLGEAMVADEDPPKDGPDDEESGIPAAYTYLGQFIDHDLTFDPASSLQRQNDPDALIDFRTPRFDLDSVYGRGPDDQPYLYSDGRLFQLGDVLTGNALGQALNAHDLARSSANPARAIIGDPRNDENVIVSQFQGLFRRFHNKVATDNPSKSFSDVQQEVRFHYQWLLLSDFLPTVVSHEVLHDVLPHLHESSNIHLHPPQLLFYHFTNDMFMPLEFSAAAYRFGHSMVRPGYRLNDDVGPFAIFPLADRPGDPGLTGFHEFPRDWAIDWGRFLDLEPRPFGDADDPANAGNPKRTQLAYKIDTSLVNPLKTLPPAVATDPPSLPERNLLRGGGQSDGRARSGGLRHQDRQVHGQCGRHQGQRRRPGRCRVCRQLPAVDLRAGRDRGGQHEGQDHRRHQDDQDPAARQGRRAHRHRDVRGNPRRRQQLVSEPEPAVEAELRDRR